MTTIIITYRTERGGHGMTEETKKLIAETVENLKHLDKESLLLIKNGAEILKIRDSLDRGFEEEKKVG